MSSRSRIASIIPIVAVATAGIAATAPAQATTSYVTAATAGTKAVGATTYMWGTTDAAPGSSICSQVSLNANWSTSQCSTVKTDHTYTVPLTYGSTTAGTYTFRAVTGGITSPSVTLTRTSGGTVPAPTTASSVMYTTGTVNVRSGAGTTYSVVTTLSKNTKVTGTVSGTWMKIATPAAVAGKYISTSVLTSAVPTTPTPAPVTTDYVKGRTTDGYVLAQGFNGVKVYLVQKALGMNPGPMGSTMDAKKTIPAVIAFQKLHKGLRTDGVVDAQTFYAIKDAAPSTAEIKKYNFDVDKWMAPAQVAAGATRQARIDAMVAFAEAQALGPNPKPYIWGGTGPMGFDCSGLMLQALRAGGYEPKSLNVSNYTDVRKASDLSNQMWLDKEFTRGSLNSLQYGDLIYYSDKAPVTGQDVVHHVAMYIGGGRVINATGTHVQYSSSSDLQGHQKQIGVNRMP